MRFMTASTWESDFTAVLVRNIAAVRADVGMTIEAFATRCNEVVGEPDRFKPNTLQGLFAGKRKNLSVAELVVFAEVLGLPIASMLIPAITNEKVPMPNGDSLSPIEWWEKIALDTTHGVAAPMGFDSGRKSFHSTIAVKEAAENLKRLRASFGLYRARQELLKEGDAPDFTEEYIANAIRRDLVLVQNSLRMLDRYGIELNLDDPLLPWVRFAIAEHLDHPEIERVAGEVSKWLGRGHR